MERARIKYSAGVPEILETPRNRDDIGNNNDLLTESESGKAERNGRVVVREFHLRSDSARILIFRGGISRW